MKTLKTVSNLPLRKGTKKSFFCNLLGPHPSMVSRASLGRLPPPKVRKNRGPDNDFLLFYDSVFTLFGDTLEMLRVFLEKQIDRTRC